MSKILSSDNIDLEYEQTNIVSLLDIELGNDTDDIESAMSAVNSGAIQLNRLKESLEMDKNIGSNIVNLDVNIYALNNICDDLGYPRQTGLESISDIISAKEAIIGSVEHGLDRLLISNEGLFSKLANKVKISLKKNETMISEIRSILKESGDKVDTSSDDYKSVVKIIFSELDPVGKKVTKVSDDIKEYKVLSDNCRYIDIAKNLNKNLKKYHSSGQRVAGLEINSILKGVNKKYAYFMAGAIDQVDEKDKVVIGAMIVENYPTLNPFTKLESVLEKLLGTTTVTLLLATNNPDNSFLKDSLNTYIAVIEHKRQDYSKLDVSVLSKKNIGLLLDLVEENIKNTKVAMEILDEAYKNAGKIDPRRFILGLMKEVEKVSNHFRKRMLLVAKTMAELYKKA